MRPIDGDALILTLIGLREEAMRRSDICEAAVESNIKTLVENAPTIGLCEDRAHGEWTCVNTDENVYMCDGDDGCGCTIQLIEGTPEDNMFDYCPECGARMDGKESRNEQERAEKNVP